MPAVAPAEVNTLPSRTKIRSGSTRTFGWRRASVSHTAQCVVARRPSNRPAEARTSAPLHTEQTRLARPASRRTPSVSSTDPAAPA